MNPELTHAFETLLRRPLTDFEPNATYALYRQDNSVTDAFFDEDLDLDLLARGEIVGQPFDGVPGLADTGFPGLWQVDLGRSVFLIEADDVPDSLWRHRRGTKVGKVLRRDPVDLSEEWVSVDLRIHTDGTLFDAMRAATWTNRAFGDGGLDPALTVEPKWERRLAAIPDPGLRDHLRELCLTAESARGAGARFLGRRHPGFPWMSAKGYRVIAAWSFGESEATSLVVQIPAKRS
ncbi:hypothetical protein [Actinoplanes couchii]|uniref:Uncharacterized protein n=1 Tax=Actinoplanes couchii TaxID=403638 RepID=A0ABQ3XKG6_9ACTN|nr:hypothetical protein [Actinoplanes couchii]MDR6320583.1 hypothetical protein [Actinoplanes couchii]GID58986.1 hypothetical protein Aco03nite_073900 [Actinoplanes couchii]